MIVNGVSIKGLWMHVKDVYFEKGDLIYGYRDSGRYAIASVRDDFVATGDFEKDLNSCGGYAGQEGTATLQDLINYLQNSGVLRYYKLSGSTYTLTTTLRPTQPLYPGLYDVRTSNGGPVGFTASNGYTTLRVYQTTNGDDSPRTYLYELINFMLGTYYTCYYDVSTNSYSEWVEMTGTAAAETLRTLYQMIETAEVMTDKLNIAITAVTDLYRYTQYNIADYFQESTRRLSLFTVQDNQKEVGYIVNMSTLIQDEDNTWKKQWTIKVLRGDSNRHVYDEYGTTLLTDEHGDKFLYIPREVELNSVFVL